MKRVLVVLPNWFGEALFATPFIRALKKQLPQIHLAVLGWPQALEVLRENPHISQFIAFDEHGLNRGFFGKWRLAAQLRKERFDSAFILRRSLSRSLLLLLAGIPMRAGFANPKSGWLLSRAVEPPGGGAHKADSYLPLLASVGLRPSGGAYEYVVSGQERLAARALLADAAFSAGGPKVILHPGANWAHKRWPAQRFARLGDRLAASGAQIILTGGPDDAGLAESVRGGMDHPVVALAGKTTIRQLGAVLEQADLVVSNDTGVLHMAAALGRPVVALYGPTSPQLTGPLGDPLKIAVVAAGQCCPQIPCYNPDKPLHPGMLAIAVEEVFAAAQRLLKQGAG